jgi:hypothetical protein
MDRKTKAVADARVLLGHFVALAANQGPIAAALAEDSRQVIAALGVDEPIRMVLWCPACGRQHLDAVPASDPGWTNPPHRSHKCASCDHVWRPADVSTEGVTVEELTTRGNVDHQPVMFRVLCARLASSVRADGLEDRVVEALRDDPNLALKVIGRLKLASAWDEDEYTIDVEVDGKIRPEQEHVCTRHDVISGECVSYLQEHEGRWWFPEDWELEDEALRGEGYATLAEIQAVDDARLTAEGWVFAGDGS